MFALLIFAVFFALALGGVPLVYALLATTVGMIWAYGLSHPLETIFLTYIGGVEPFILIAVPLFVFAGELLSHGGVGRRIVDFAHALFGWLPGGLGIVTVASCLMFGGVSGSAMVNRGYPRAFVGALLATAGTLALLMPLSIPFLVYAFTAGVSMRTLSMAGIVPALLSAVALMAVCMWYGKRHGCDPGSGEFSLAAFWKSLRAAGPALLMPLIIVGGIWSGYFTPTEAAAVAVVYGLAVSLGYYRDIGWRDVPRLLLGAFQTSAVVMVVLGATAALAWFITAEQVPAQLAAWVKGVASEAWVFLLLVNISLLVLGIFIEPLPALLISVPLFLPLAAAFKIDPVHLGVVMCANLAIALYTPPVGGTLFVAAKLANAGIGAITRHLLPFMAATVAVLLLVTYVPSLTLGVARFLQ